MKTEIKERESPDEKKKTLTAFLLMFPSVIIAVVAMIISNAPIWANFLIVGLIVYQFVLLQQFIQDFYKIKY